MKESKTQWCDATFNPWLGCSKVSPGCAKCYAEKLCRRFNNVRWGADGDRRRTGAGCWEQPRRWNISAEQSGKPTRVFCGSCCDWLDDEVPVSWLARLLKLAEETPSLTWMTLTKRPHLWGQRVAMCAGRTAVAESWLDGQAPANVWVGTSVEDQVRAEERLPALLATPAALRFLSVEPMLGPVDLAPWLAREAGGGIGLVIVGGESGGGARPCDTGWIRSVVGQCCRARVPCFVKQLGSNAIDDATRKRLRLEDKKGGDPAEWPLGLWVRDWPRGREVSRR